MDLKFSFGGASPDHDHSGHGSGGAPSGVPLPFAGATPVPLSTSSTLELRVSLGEAAVVCEALSGDGVSYARAEKASGDRSPAALAAAVRSALARTGAELPEPLIGSVTDVTLALGGAEDAVLAELGLGGAPSAVDAALQARTGIAVGTPMRIG